MQAVVWYGLALLAGIAGWFYLFYSRGEKLHLSGRRMILRRCGGGVMLLLGVMFAILYSCAQTRPASVFLGGLLIVLLLLAVLIVLAIIDLRLTWRARRESRRDT